MSRLKTNANPISVGVNQVCLGNSLDVAGKKLRDVLPLLKQQLQDVK